MAKIILLNPAIEFKNIGVYRKFFFAMPTIAMAYLAGALESCGHTVKVIDLAAEPKTIKEGLAIIKQFDAEFVGISCLTPTAACSFAIAQEIRLMYPQIRIIFGNIHSAYYAKEIINRDLADVVIHGEGEKSLIEVINAFQNKTGLSDIAGISFNNNGNVVYNGPREPVKDIDTLTYPAWHLLPIDKYKIMTVGGAAGATVGLMASRGCPNACRYCCSAYENRFFRKRQPESVVNEILHIRDQYRVKQFIFMDPIFPFEKNQAMQIFEKMTQKNIGSQLKWGCETHPDLLDDELLKKMKEAGCYLLYLGIESASTDLLNYCGRKIDIEHTRKIIKTARRLGIVCFGLFMIGLPGETKDSAQGTLDFACELDIDFCKISIYTPLPGSQLFDELLCKHRIINQDWENYNFHTIDQERIIYHPDNLTAKELIKLQFRGYRKFYLRPKMIFRHLSRIRYLTIGQLISGFLGTVTRH